MTSWRLPDPFSYSYLLGMYLGDGCVSVTRRSYQLVIACDAGYPQIIEDCATAMTLTLLPRHVGRNRHREHQCVRVEGASQRWTQSNPRNISISHRTSVALVDAFVPAKS